MRFLNSKVTLVLLLATFYVSCSEQDLNERLLAKAVGKTGELFVVMDSIQWKGELGESIRSSIMVTVPGLPNDEPYFKVRYIEPTKFNSVLERVTNILFVATLDSKTMGGESVRNKITKNYIQEHPNRYIISQKDVFAKGQSVLYLFGADQKVLADSIYQNKSVIRNFFNAAEQDRLLESLYKSSEKIGINKMLLEKHTMYLRIPNGYRLEQNKPGFVWIRSPGTAAGNVDRNIFISYRPYTSEATFDKSEIIAWRDEITKENIFENPDNPNSYMETDTLNVAVNYKSIKLGGNFAREIRGIWKTHDLGLGGAYISYVVLDKELGKIFYLDGFVVSPGKPKSETIRQLETILSTFRTKSQMTATEKKQRN